MQDGFRFKRRGICLHTESRPPKVAKLCNRNATAVRYPQLTTTLLINVIFIFLLFIAQIPQNAPECIIFNFKIHFSD